MNQFRANEKTLRVYNENNALQQLQHEILFLFIFIETEHRSVLDTLRCDRRPRAAPRQSADSRPHAQLRLRVYQTIFLNRSL